MAEWSTLGALGEKIPADVIAVPAPRMTSSDLVHVPRNPARAPQGLEDAVYEMAIKPLSDIGMGVGSVVEGQGWNSPEASAGFLAAMGLLTPLRAGALRPGIKAYHVSPYDFDRFRMDKIGEGQGAQSYGHGLYFAENPKVSGGPGSQYWNEFAEVGKFPNIGDPATDTAVRFLQMAQGDRAAAIGRLESVRAKLQDPNQSVDEALNLLKSGKPVGPRTYEVSINAKPEQFLDWDRPLAAQPEHFGRLREAGIIGDKSPPYQKSGQATPQALVQMPGEKGAIEAQLRDAGIPGIRYLDQGSRGQGTGTSNYVLFRDDIIDILRKYGIMAPASGVALDQATQRQ
jgi:hypothetical protein